MKLNRMFYRVLFLISAIFVSSITFSQTQQMSREEVALQKAEEKVEKYRLKLIDIKRDIESADSLFVAGEALEESAKLKKEEARNEIKLIEKQYKKESKPYKKMANSKDRSESADGRTQLREITTKYKADLKEAQNREKAAIRDMSTSYRMIEKADKKLDLLKTKLKAAEDSYEDSEKALNEKKESK